MLTQSKAREVTPIASPVHSGDMLDVAPPYLAPPQAFPEGPAPHHFAHLARTLPHVPIFLTQPLWHEPGGWLKKTPIGLTGDLNPNSPIADYDTAPYLLGAKAYSGSLLGRVADLGPALDSFWSKGSPAEGSTADQMIKPSVSLFYLRYQQYAIDLIRNHCGRSVMEALRSAGCTMLRFGIQPSSITMPLNEREQQSKLEKQKRRLIDDGVPIASGGSLRIAPHLVNYLAPRLERLADFVAQINTDVAIESFGLKRSEFSNSVISPNSGRALVYHLALTLGALTNDDYDQLHSTCSYYNTVHRHFGEVLVATDVRLLVETQYDAWLKRKAVEHGGEYHASYQQFLIDRAVPEKERLFIQEITLQHLDVLLAFGERGVTFWADIGQKLDEHGINLNPKEHSGLARGVRARDGTHIYVHERVMDLTAFNRHSAWLRAREICAAQPLADFHPSSHPADFRWNPREAPTDALYDPDRLGALTFAHALHRLRNSSQPEEASLFRTLVELGDQVGKLLGTGPKLALHAEIGAELLVLDPDTIEALTLLRRVMGREWQKKQGEVSENSFADLDKATLRAAFSNLPVWGKAWQDVKPHQRLFESLYTLMVAEQARSFSPATIRALKAFTDWTKNSTKICCLISNQSEVSLKGFKDGKERTFSLSPDVFRELLAGFEKARILAQDQALTIAQSLKSSVLLRNSSTAGDLNRIAKEIQSPAQYTSDPARSLDRVGTFARSLGEIPHFSSSFFQLASEKSGQAELLASNALHQRFSTLEIRAFGERFLRVRADLEQRMRSDPRCEDWEEQSPLAKSGTELMATQLMGFMVSLGQPVLRDLRAMGECLADTDIYHSIRNLVYEERVGELGVRLRQSRSRLIWPNAFICGAISTHLHGLQTRSMNLIDALNRLSLDSNESQSSVAADANALSVRKPVVLKSPKKES